MTRAPTKEVVVATSGKVNRFPFQDLPKDKLVSTSFEVSLKDAANPAFNVRIDTSALYGSLDQFAQVSSEHEDMMGKLGKDQRQGFAQVDRDFEEFRSELDATRRAQDAITKAHKAQKNWQIQLREELMEELRNGTEKARISAVSEAKEALDAALQRHGGATDAALAKLTDQVQSLRGQLQSLRDQLQTMPAQQTPPRPPNVPGILASELEAQLAALRAEIQSKLDVCCTDLKFVREVTVPETAARAVRTAFDECVEPQLVGLWDGIHKQTQRATVLRSTVERVRSGTIAMAASALLPSADRKSVV